MWGCRPADRWFDGRPIDRKVDGLDRSGPRSPTLSCRQGEGASRNGTETAWRGRVVNKPVTPANVREGTRFVIRCSGSNRSLNGFELKIEFLERRHNPLGSIEIYRSGAVDRPTD